MTSGALGANVCIVLHAHLPDVRGEGGLEERWYFEALADVYLRVLRVLESDALARVTLSISPPLLSMMNDVPLRLRFESWLEARTDVAALLAQQLKGSPFASAARADHMHMLQTQAHASAVGSNPLRALRSAQKAGVVSLWTTSATHALLPTLSDDAWRSLQVSTGLRLFEQCVGRAADGFWLPECAVDPAALRALSACGVQNTLVEDRAILLSRPRAPYGFFAPVRAEGVTFFARASALCSHIWSKDHGYPGDGYYREFHVDAAHMFPRAWFSPLVSRADDLPSGVRLHRVTDKLNPNKAAYEPELAMQRAAGHAAHFADALLSQVRAVKAQAAFDPTLVLAFDAELFGHWWFEGPAFLSALCKKLTSRGFSLTTPAGVLEQGAPVAMASPSTSTWGRNGDLSTWFNEATSQGSARLRRIETQALQLLRSRALPIANAQRVVGAVLAAQASDYPFLIATGSNVGFGQRAWNARLDHAERMLASSGLEPDATGGTLASFVPEHAIQEISR